MELGAKKENPFPYPKKKTYCPLPHVLTNHLYQFNGKLYRQNEGGPIGDKLTTILARILMNDFTNRYKLKLKQLK